VRESGGEVVFLKRVREGPSDNSYGIHVARLAGLPAETIAAAEKILATLNAEGGLLPAALPVGPPAPPGAVAATAEAAPIATPPPGPGPAPGARQAFLFTPEELVLKELHGLRIEGMTPLEALNRIARWKEELGRSGDA
ncbi:MAG: hypothetical protein NT005_08435, partial [Spirochaetes bacterium]|nr:hypothetical protein [Spirochaetota bacterium]